FVLERGPERLADAGLVVDYQNTDTLHGLRAGCRISDVGFRVDSLPTSEIRHPTSSTASLGSSDSTTIGISTVKRAPAGTLSSTRIVALCSERIWFTMASPNPVPRPLVEKYGRKRRSLSSAETPQPVSAS